MISRFCPQIVLAALSLQFFSHCGGPSPAQENATIPEPPVGTVAPMREKPKVQATSPMRTVYRHELRPGEQLWLLGVDRKNEIAYLRSSVDSPAAFEIVAVHYSQQPAKITRWVADPTNAKVLVASDAFQPLDGSLESDLSRYARVVEDMGSWSSRQWIWPPHVAASSGHIVYKTPPPGAFYGDWLMLADREGKNPTRLGASTRAAYGPVFSPDQERIAFYACTGSPCVYALYIADTLGHETRVSQVRDPEPPLFARGGMHIITTAHPQDGKGCLMRVETANPANVETLTCLEGTSRARFAIDPTGAIALVYGDPPRGSTARPQAQIVDIVAGKTIRVLEQPIGPLPTISPDGWIINHWRSMQLIHTARNQVRSFEVDSLLTFSDDWQGGRVMVTRFSTAGIVEVVEIDLGKLLTLPDGANLDVLLDKAAADLQ